MVSLGQILEGVDFKKFTLRMVHRALLQNFPSLDLEPRKQFIQDTILNIKDPNCPPLHKYELCDSYVIAM